MIRLAQEIPTCKLQEWSRLSDLDFILAHTVLADPEYAEFFHERSEGRELILDNSYHELGYPLPMDQLLEAAKRCRADYVIAPDKVGDCEFNKEQFCVAMDILWGFKIAVVMTGAPSGTSLVEQVARENFLFDVCDADMLCLTFKEPLRYRWYTESAMAHRWKRVHLLGVAERDELEKWYPLGIPGREFSVDTGKALKWALRGKKLDEITSWRFNTHTTEKGLPSEESQKILDVKSVTPEQEELFKHNVSVLKRCVQ